jgi:hypothetical protein
MLSAFGDYIADYSLGRAAYGLPMNRDLAIRKDHFVSIMDACRFPKEFYEALCEKTGHFAHFINFMDDESPGWICKLWPPLSRVHITYHVLQPLLSKHLTRQQTFRLCSV